jgi:glutathione S-transferase
MNQLTLVGRSSSHFTRVARIFALELAVPHVFQPVFDLTTLDASGYAGNPMLKVPIWLDEQGQLFGTENICRELARRSGHPADVVMRGDVATRVVANAEELTVSAMLAEVTVITSRLSGAAPTVQPKLLRSIENCLDFLERHLDEIQAALPPARRLSFVEVCLFCLVRHLPFREIMAVDGWPRLATFASGFDQRQAASATEYRFDQPTS